MRSPPSPILALFLLVMLTILWWAPLGSSRPLARPDEARYAEISREMAATEDFVTPRLNGLKYFEKPPLQYWATALSFEAFGVHEWSARLWTTFTGFLTVIFAGLIARTLKRPVLPVLLLSASTFYGALLGHINTLDSGLTAFMTGALWSYLQANTARESSRWMALSGLFTGLAILSKGPVALVIPGLAVVLYTLFERNLLAFKRLHLVTFMVSLLVITAPWFVLCSMRNPEFAHFFFIHEHFERYTSTVHQRVEPFWYFLPVLVLGLLPWTLSLPRALLDGFHERVTVSGFRPTRFLIFYALGIVLFFSASGSKLPTYILPAFPALTVLLGLSLERRRSLGLVALSAGCFGALLVFAALLFKFPEFTALLKINLDMDPDMVGPYRAFASALLISGGVFLGVALLSQLFRHAGLWLIALGALLAADIGLMGATHLSPFNSVFPWIESWKDQVDPKSRFFSIRTYEQTLPFYLGRTVTLVDFRDELGPGIDAEPDRALPSIEAFQKTWGEEPHDFAILEPQTLKLFDEHHLRYRIVAQDPRHVVVSAR